MRQVLRQRRWHRVLTLVFFGCIAVLLLGYAAPAVDVARGGLSGSGAASAGALVSLVKQRDEQRIIETVRNVEDRYNHRFAHDWVFLSEEEFRPDFKERVAVFVSGRAVFRTINRNLHWQIPDFIDRNRLRNDMRNLDINGVPYGGSTTYRLMSRFQTGFFVEYLPEYRYYARIDPDIKFYCDVTDDLFEVMRREKKKYGFAISLREFPHAAHDLSHVVNVFMQENKDLILPQQWLDSFVQPWDRLCHFWSNFEVADLDFFRSKSFKKLFTFLEMDGGIFYNRWGDAPIHTIAASLFLDPREVHWFRNVGMYHAPNMNCPTSAEDRRLHRCSCPGDSQLPNQNSIFTYTAESCVPHFLNLTGEPFQDGWRDYASGAMLNLYD